MIAAESACDQRVLGGGIADRSACGAPAARTADTVGEFEPGFGNDQQTCLVGKHRGAFRQIEARGRPAPVLGF